MPSQGFSQNSAQLRSASPCITSSSFLPHFYFLSPNGLGSYPTNKTLGLSSYFSLLCGSRVGEKETRLEQKRINPTVTSPPHTKLRYLVIQRPILPCSSRGRRIMTVLATQPGSLETHFWSQQAISLTSNLIVRKELCQAIYGRPTQTSLPRSGCLSYEIVLSTVPNTTN